MLKKIIVSLVVLILLIAGGAYFYVDALVKSGIEVVGSRVLGTSVTVSSVAILPLNGSGTLRGLNVGNPEGFNSDYAMQLEEIAINLNTRSLFTDVVEIESVTIVQPRITYETRITTDNIRALMNNLPDSGATDDAAAPSAQGGKRLIVREFRMVDPQLNLVAVVVTAPIPLPDIVLRDIGEDGDSATTAEVLRTVLGALSRVIIQAELPSVDELRRQAEGRLRQGVEEVENSLEDAVDDAAEELGNRLRRILN